MVVNGDTEKCLHLSNLFLALETQFMLGSKLLLCSATRWFQNVMSVLIIKRRANIHGWGIHFGYQLLKMTPTWLAKIVYFLQHYGQISK